MIGGITCCSFIDFPGRLSAVAYVRGCNLRCPYCHNAGLTDPEGPCALGPEAFLRFIESRRGRLDGVVFSGGEPTLQPRLRALIEVTRNLGFAVKLDTNGTRPDVLEDLLTQGLLDYIALDLKDEPAAYVTWLGPDDPQERLSRSLDLVKRSGVDHELRTTVVPGRHDAERLARMADSAVGCRRWILQACRRNTQCSSPSPAADEARVLDEHARRLSAAFGVNCRPRGSGHQSRLPWPLQPIDIRPA
jgi:pyruvate formate lyase activating enzyme